MESSAVDINWQKNKGKYTLLHAAAALGNSSVCEKLLQCGASVNLMSANKDTPLHLALEKGNMDVFQMLLNAGANIYSKGKDKTTSLHLAARNGHLELCKELLEKYNFHVHMTDEHELTPLHCAALSGSYKLFLYFLKMGSDAHAKAIQGISCLNIAALKGHLDLCKMLLQNHKFDVHITDYYGQTPLHCAAMSGSYELFQFLVNMKRDVYLKTKEGRNCLHFAAGGGNLSFCKTLLKSYCFDIHKADHFGWTPLHRSAKSGSYELFQFFIDRGSRIYLKTNDNKNCLHISSKGGYLNFCKSLIEVYNFDLLLKDNLGKSPFYYSAESGDLKLFIYLLDKGSELYSKTKHRSNVLHLAAQHGHVEICEYILKRYSKEYESYNKNKRYTLNGNLYSYHLFFKYKNIFLQAKDADGDTYLHCAAVDNQAEVCNLLLSYEIDVTLLNEKDETARDIAIKYNYEDVLNVMKADYDRVGKLSFFNCFYLIFNKNERRKKILLFDSFQQVVPVYVSFLPKNC